MDAIEAVIEVVKERDELADILEDYESWFELLVGKRVTVAQRSKKKTTYVSAVVEEFTPGEGWMARDIEGDDCVAITFEDFANGDAWVNKD